MKVSRVVSLNVFGASPLLLCKLMRSELPGDLRWAKQTRSHLMLALLVFTCPPLSLQIPFLLPWDCSAR